MEKSEKIKRIIEALLIAFNNGLSREELKSAMDNVDARDIEESIRSLRDEYNTGDRAFELREIAGKVFIATKPEYGPWIRNLYQKEPARLTAPSLETLAIVAYRQPVTRAEIEGIRGVNVGGVIKTLLEKELVSVRGRKDVVGKPLLYGTTDKFLELFGLNSLDDLPELRVFTEEDLEYTRPQEHVIVESMEGEGKESGENETEKSEPDQERDRQDRFADS